MTRRNLLLILSIAQLLPMAQIVCKYCIDIKNPFNYCGVSNGGDILSIQLVTQWHALCCTVNQFFVCMQRLVLKTYNWLLVTTVLLTITIFIVGIGNIPLLSFNEARRAIPISNIVSHGDWLIPRINGEMYVTKPPLLYWLSAIASIAINDVNEWSVRIVSALSATATAWLVFVYARKNFGDWSALFALQLIVANVGFSMLARQAGIEMLLTLLCFSSFICAVNYIYEGGTKWIFSSYVLLGLAVLTKGPIAFLFVTAPLLVIVLTQKNQRRWDVLANIPAWILALLIGSSWYIAVTYFIGPDVWSQIIKKDLLQKVNGKDGEAIYSYLVWIATDFFPAIILILVAFKSTCLRWKNNKLIVSLAIGILTPLLIYSAFSDKHAKYMLPVYPILAIILGHRLGEIYITGKDLHKKILISISLLIMSGYALFYLYGQKIALNHRYQVLPELHQWSTNINSNTEIFAINHLDERAIYYLNRSVPIINEHQLKSLHSNGAIVLAEDTNIPIAKSMAECTLRVFKPYLKKSGILVAFGYGSICHASAQDLN